MKSKTFKVGDKVRVTRAAESHERGWGNSWVPGSMDKAVGNIGTIKDISLTSKYDVTVSGPKVPSFGYPSFVLELIGETPKPVVQPVKRFNIGDRVRVKYGYGRGGVGTIVRLSTEADTYIVQYDNKRQGSFHTSKLTLIVEENTIKTFKIGDQVRAPGRYSFDAPSTVTKIGKEFVYIKVNSKSHVYSGGFYPRNLKFEPEQVIAKSVTLEAPYETPKPAVRPSVFAIAKKIAVEIAEHSALGLANVDQVQSRLEILGYTSADLGNAAGVVFRGKNWKKYNAQKSVRKGNHLREITNWKYVGN